MSVVSDNRLLSSLQIKKSTAHLRTWRHLIREADGSSKKTPTNTQPQIKISISSHPAHLNMELIATEGHGF